MNLCIFENQECKVCGAPKINARQHCGVFGPEHILTLPAPTHGPGTELKKLLSRVGITASPDCSCNARARLMDENEQREPGWVEANLDTVVGWLREEATKRGLPFVDMAGRMLVRRAIKNARNA